MQTVLGGSDDAGLVRAAERERVPSRRRCVSVGRGRAAGRERTGREAGGRDAAADQATARDPGTPGSVLGRVDLGVGLLGQDSTAAVSRDSGSESALTAFASASTSSSVRSS